MSTGDGNDEWHHHLLPSDRLMLPDFYMLSPDHFSMIIFYFKNKDECIDFLSLVLPLYLIWTASYQSGILYEYLLTK